MTKPLKDWLDQQPKGALTRLMLETKLAWATVCRAKRGVKVDFRTAVLISRATGGAVPIDALTDKNVLDIVGRERVA